MSPRNMNKIEGVRFGEERALYGSRDVHLINCVFDGIEDGESALKESSHILVEETLCNLRYPFWHDTNLELNVCEMTDQCRAALWYSEDIRINRSKLHGTKALRECTKIRIKDCDILSAEFGWFCQGIEIANTSAEGEYFMLRARELAFRDLRFRGKYSFQYIENATLEHCELDTKDAFWHARNVTVKDSVIRGEYLGWYSEGLTLIHCKIIGTQPLCYCKDLRLIDCEMLDTDLAFECSHVEATVTTPLISIKNPFSGFITAPNATLILDDPRARCRITLTQKN